MVPMCSDSFICYSPNGEEDRVESQCMCPLLAPLLVMEH